MNGVMTMALGAPKYGNIAAMLAATLRVAQPDIQIALVYEASAISQLQPEHLALFNQLIPFPEAAMAHGRGYQCAKIHAWELSPFERTFFLDADTAWHPESSIDFWDGIWFQCYGESAPPKWPADNHGYTYWQVPSRAAAKYQLEHALPCISTTAFAFDRSPKAEAVFCWARRAVYTPEISVIRQGALWPDEAFFALACAKAGAHIPKYAPVYFANVHANLPASLVRKQFLATTPAGNSNGGALAQYHQLTQNAAMRLGVPHFKYSK